RYRLDRNAACADQAAARSARADKRSAQLGPEVPLRPRCDQCTRYERDRRSDGGARSSAPRPVTVTTLGSDALPAEPGKQLAIDTHPLSEFSAHGFVCDLPGVLQCKIIRRVPCCSTSLRY